jgi:membrane-bound lytic murein transglycosylase
MNKKNFLIFITVFIFPKTGHPRIESHFKPTKVNFNNEKVEINPERFLRAVEFPLKHQKNIIHNRETENTLKYFAKIIKSDKKRYKNKFRILNPNFLKKHFTFIKWNSDPKKTAEYNISIPKWINQGKLPKDKIKLTGYAIFRYNGSYHKTKKYRHALYEIKKNIFRKKYKTKFSKQQIINGVLARPRFRKLIKPLVWLSREGLKQALLQGSIFLKMPDGRQRLFNVYENNGMPYSKKIKIFEDQKIYWYFREIKNRKNLYERKLLDFIQLGGVAFAGDMDNIGAGRVIAVRYTNPKSKKKEILLGVLADIGSAFTNNLNQIDLYAGIFDNREKFKNYIGRFPDAADVYILKLKR